MRARNRLSTLLILVSCLVSRALVAESAVQWQPTLENAKRVAGQTNRLVLIHFVADGCPPCRAMDQYVFSRQDVADTLAKQYVAVKVDRDQWPATSRQYGVTVAPTDVVITPQGLLIDKMVGAAPAETYIAKLEKIAAYYRQQTGQQLVQSPIRAIRPVGPSAPDFQQPPVYVPPNNQFAERYNPPPTQNGPVPELGGSNNPMPEQYVNPPIPPQNEWSPTLDRSPRPNPPLDSSGPGGVTDPNLRIPPPSNAEGRNEPNFNLPAGSPPLALDGYCVVKLAENKKYWVRGDDRWGVLHNGRTYLFSGPEEAERFYQNPERYAPVLSGNDVVMAVEQHREVPGIRKYGGWFKDLLYLFSSGESFEKFKQNPQYYQEKSKSLLTETAERQPQNAIPPTYPHY